MNKGYVSLYRKIQENPIWNEKPFDKAHAWMDLLIMANHNKREILHNGKVYKLNRGEVLVSKVKLAEKWGWSRPKVYRFFDFLTEQGMIQGVVTPDVTQNVTPNITHIKLVNYSKFQDKQTRNVTPIVTPNVTVGVTPDVTHTIINNNYNNKNNVSARTRETDTHDKTDFNFQDVVDLYNTICVSLKKVKAVTPSMKDNIANIQKRFVGIDFKALFEQVEKSDFLTGRKSGWRGCNLTWILNPDNTAKILNGDYDDFDKKEEVRNASYSLADFESKSLFTD